MIYGPETPNKATSCKVSAVTVSEFNESWNNKLWQEWESEIQKIRKNKFIDSRKHAENNGCILARPLHPHCVKRERRKETLLA